MAEKAILIIGCFDTKGDVFAFLRNRILEQGEKVVTINTGVMGTTTLFPVDYEASLVASQGGVSLEVLRETRDRGHAINVMGKGASLVVEHLVQQGLVKGAIGMGGGGGTYITLSAMQQIPLGIPKLCLTTIATKDLSRQIGNKDVTLMPSIVDVAGLNTISNTLITQAAAAIIAMSKAVPPVRQAPAGVIAISMFGNTTPCVDRCTTKLEALGYEVFAFHATGVGGKAMEALIREKCFDAVLDVTTTELADDLCGGICSAGPERLDAASEMGIPQVIVPGCLDMVNFAQLDTVPEKYKDRYLYSWAPDVTLMRTDAAENAMLGKSLAEKASKTQSEAVIVLPLQGISQVDSEGGIFYRPDIDLVLFDSIKAHVAPHVEVKEYNLPINDPAFADHLVDELLRLIKQKQ